VPVAVKVAVAPVVHNAEGLLVTVRVGTLFTVTFRVFVLVQPAVVPITVYVVDTDGVAVVVPDVVLLGIQLYVAAPLAVKLTVAPAQITLGETEATTVGVAVTLRFTVCELLQPKEVPITV
jgi:hypothetical protein